MSKEGETYTVEELLDLLDQALAEAKGVPLTNYATIDRSYFKDKIQEIRFHLPSELQKANDVLDREKSIIDSANRRALTIAENAKKEHDDLVNQQSVMEDAVQQAQDILANAHKVEHTIYSEAKGYADELLADLNQQVAELRAFTATQLSECAELIAQNTQELIDALGERSQAMDEALRQTEETIEANRKELKV